MMEILAIIPARGGSKGIQGKNLRMIAGQSLVGRAVRTARQSTRVSRVVVSTDDPAISEEARAHGAEVVIRPAEIAGDKSSSEMALLHVLERLAANQGYHPDIMVFLQCTAPLIMAEDIDGTVEVLLNEDADAAFAAVPFHHFVWRQGGDVGWNGVNHDYRIRQRRQDRHEEVIEAGAVYALRTEPFLKVRHRFCGKLAVWTIPRDRFLEIDESEDLVLAEALLGLKHRTELSFLPDAVVFDFDGVLTDNRVWLDGSGNELVSCNRGDGMGIEMLRELGIPTLILSKETDEVVGARARKLGIEVIQGCNNKLPAMKMWAKDKGASLDRVVYVGNDINDVACMEAVGYAVAPADGFPRAKAVADQITQAKGGFGVAREVAEFIIALEET